MDWFIIGTAGHVDHGKTQLVKSLTGQDTDRLKEEKQRGISIELGFASLALPHGQNAAIIDVPGHERFIRQMLSGVAGIDMVMLIIAADEGVMPQTREHLDIIELLQIEKGLTVITKTDLVDEDWLDLVEEDIRDFLTGTILEKGPIIKVSALKNKGMDDLLAAIQKVADSEFTQKEGEGRLRLPVDRSFTLSGFGTVVTGTLWSGTVNVGDIVEVQPTGKKVRVRGIQIHGQSQKEAHPGQRVALNLADVEVEEIPRGSTVVSAGTFEGSFKLDVKLTLLKNAAKPIKQRQRVRVHLGTSERLARINLLEGEELQPGEETYAQLHMEEPMIAQRGDRFVIRSYSPMITIGGGTILEPHGGKYKRFNEEVLQTLAIKEENDPEELVLHTLEKNKKRMWTLEDLEKSTNLPRAVLESLLKKHESVIKVTGEGMTYFVGTAIHEQWQTAIAEELRLYHEKHPLRPGMDKEELRSRRFPEFSIKEFNAVLQHWQLLGCIETKNPWVSLPGFTVTLSQEEQQVMDSIQSEFLSKGFQPPTFEEAAEAHGLSAAQREEWLRYLIAKGTLVKAAENILFHQNVVEKAKALLQQHVKGEEGFALAEIRDYFNSSRKYLLPLLEYLDTQKITKRIGDKRVLLKKDG